MNDLEHALSLHVYDINEHLANIVKLAENEKNVTKAALVSFGIKVSWW